MTIPAPATTAPAAAAPVAPGFVRAGFAAGGIAAFALGALGLVVPLLPTTIFWIAAAWCFGKSCPRWQARLFAHPRLGRSLSDFVAHGAISRRAKRASLLGMAASLALSLLILRPGWPVALLLLASLGGVALYIATRPETAPGP